MKKLSFFLFIFFAAFAAHADDIMESTQTVKEEAIWERHPKQVSISGIVLTPTAYRSNGINEIGPALDFNAAYYIGRLYGKNTFQWTTDKKNYLDRIGVWYFEADGKLLLQRETKYFPAFSSGFKGIFSFRDNSQPSLENPQTSFTVNNDNTNTYTSIYFVLSKQITERFIVNAGYMDGDFSKFIYQTSDFLSNQGIYNTTGGMPYTSKSTLFGGMMYLAGGKTPLGFEIIMPQGSTLSPKLINLQLGTLLKLNFQVSYLKYTGGYEYLGTFNFRYSFFPRIKKIKTEGTTAVETLNKTTEISLSNDTTKDLTSSTNDQKTQLPDQSIPQ
jgi:hypothetical protein